MKERGVLNTMLASAAIVILCFIGSCKDDSIPNPGPPVVPTGIGKASIWVTTGDKSRLLAQGQDVTITELKTVNTPTVTIDTTTALQEIEGFGAALTGSSAYVIDNMSATQRNALLRDLFDPETGIGINYLRLTMGASDFSLADYTYNDMPSGQTDETLNNFSLSRDSEDVLPVLKQIVSIIPNLKIMGSPWSAPAWMKTNGNMRFVNGQTNKLRPEYYSAYAKYFVKYIKAMSAEGITIDAITPQNEPLYFNAPYPSMDMQPGEQAAFIKNNLGPEFASAGVNTKIIIYDHNFDRSDYPITVLNDAAARQYIAGSAFHAYNDLNINNASVMTTVRNAYPEKGLYFTEISGGAWATNFSDNMMWNMQNIFIGTTKNWSKTVLLWNLALDPASGPKNDGCQDCRGVVTVAGNTVTKNEEYYSIGHFSKFIRYGASRVQSTEFNGNTGLISVAFMNQDKSKVLVVANTSSEGKDFTVKQGNRQFTTFITQKTVVTLQWK